MAQAALALKPYLPRAWADRLDFSAAGVFSAGLGEHRFMCGIIGVVAHTPVNQVLYDGLLLLQHRGQDAAGIVTNDGASFHMHKASGYVRDVFRTRNMRDLLGHVGIGHCRYPTAGSASSELESQPFYVNSPFGITLAHNGNLTNSEALKRELFQLDFRHVNTNSDSEVLLNVLALELERAAHHAKLDANAIFTAVAGVHRRCRGAYAIVALIAGCGLVAFRDPFGIRPLIIGVNEAMGGTEYVVASESVALEALGFSVLRDVAPGEAVFIDQTGQFHSRLCADHAVLAPCIFEYVYLARPDSVIDGTSVYESRLNMGEQLAHKIRGIPEATGHRRRDPHSGFEPPVRAAAREHARAHVSRGLRQEPLHRAHVHHAGPGVAQEERAPEAEPDRHGIQGQGRAARRRFDRARHDVARDRADGARSRRAQGVFRVREPAGALSERLRDRHAEPARARRHRAARKPRSRAKSARICSSTRSSTRSRRRCGEGNPRLSEFEASCFDGKYITGDVTADYLSQLAEVRDVARGEVDADAETREPVAAGD